MSNGNNNSASNTGNGNKKPPANNGNKNNDFPKIQGVKTALESDNPLKDKP